MSSETFLLIGLGNPGSKYAGTRHNIGFSVIDEVARLGATDISLQKWEAHTAKITLWGKVIHLIKPMTYMNRSGKSVAKFIDFYKVPSSNILVIHDDLDMTTGRLKLVHGGGTGGHNGIRSIVAVSGEKAFYRLKIGIGRPGNGLAHENIPVDKYVLTAFYDEEIKFLKSRMITVLEGLQRFYEADATQAMNYLNSFK